jgi:hypothetical protein
MYLAKTSQICSLRQHNLDVNGRKILQEHKTIYVYLCIDMDMSYTRVLHIKVAYRVPHK